MKYKTKKILRIISIWIVSIILFAIGLFLLFKFDNSSAFDLGIALWFIAFTHHLIWPDIKKPEQPKKATLWEGETK